MADSNATLATRDQQISELEKASTALVLGQVLRDAVVDLTEEADNLSAELRAVEIVDEETCALATDALRRRKGWENRVVQVIDPYRDAANQVRTKFINLTKSVLQTGELDAASAKQRRDAYLDELERQKRKTNLAAAEQQQSLEIEARQDAAKETLALGGTQESADQILNERIALPAPSAAPPLELEGNYGRDHWTWRYASSEAAALKKLVKLAAKKGGDRYLGFLMLNESAITSEAKTKKTLAKIPGIEVFNDRKRIDRAK